MCQDNSFEWRRPPFQVLAGIAIGLCGVALLVGPGRLVGGEGADPLGAAVLVLASLSWATGSLYARRAPLPSSPLLGTAMEMIGGGLCLVVAGLVAGEHRRLDLAAASPKSLLAVAYLVVFGSLIGFTAYIFLLRHTRPSLVATYAYVNPVVAVLLGWAFAGEPLSARTLLAGGIIVGAVVLITTHRQRPWAGQGATAHDVRQEEASGAPPAAPAGRETELRAS